MTITKLISILQQIDNKETVVSVEIPGSDCGVMVISSIKWDFDSAELIFIGEGR